MADNVTVDNGGLPAYDVVTDEITSPYTGGTRHAQGVKLLSGAANSNEVIEGTAANGLEVDVTRVQGTVTVGDGGSTISVDDGGGSITVDGTVAVTEPVSVDDNGGSLTVDNAALSVTGGGAEATALRVTLANDSTGVVSVDDNGSTLSVDDGGASLTVDGTVTANLAAGTNNIGDVDVASIAAGDNTVGRVKITDGTDVADVLDLTNANPLTVAIVDGSGTQVTSFGGSGGTSATDDAAFTPGSGSGTPIMGFADETAPDSVNEGDVGVVRMTLPRALHVNLRDSSGNEVSPGAGTQYTEGDVDASITGTAMLWEDASDTLRAVSAAKPLPVDLQDASVAVTDNGGSLTVDNGGTFAVQESGAALTALQLLDDTVYTDGTGTPSKALGIAGTDGTNPQIVKTDSAGELQIDVLSIAAGDNNIGNVDIASALPAGTNAIGKLAANSGVDIGDVDVTSVTPGTAAGSLGKAEDAVHASGDTGVYALAVRDTDPAAHSGTDGDYESLHVSDEGGLWASEVATSRGGCTPFRSIDLDETEEEVKGTAGSVYGWFIANLATSTRYVKFYNATAANVTVGTTTPILTLPIPGNSTDDVAANMAFAPGIKFDTAITVAATTGIADNDTGAPGTNEVVINLFYK